MAWACETAALVPCWRTLWSTAVSTLPHSCWPHDAAACPQHADPTTFISPCAGTISRREKKEAGGLAANRDYLGGSLR